MAPTKVGDSFKITQVLGLASQPASYNGTDIFLKSKFYPSMEPWGGIQLDYTVTIKEGTVDHIT